MIRILVSGDSYAILKERGGEDECLYEGHIDDFDATPEGLRCFIEDLGFDVDVMAAWEDNEEWD